MANARMTEPDSQALRRLAARAAVQLDQRVSMSTAIGAAIAVAGEHFDQFLIAAAHGARADLDPAPGQDDTDRDEP